MYSKMGVVLAVLSVAALCLFFAPWGKIITIQRPTGTVTFRSGGKVGPGVIEALERETGTVLRERIHIKGYQCGYHIGAVGWIYLALATAILVFAVFRPKTRGLPPEVPIAAFSIVALAALASVFLPRMQLIAWGGVLAMVVMLLIFVTSLAQLAKSRAVVSPEQSAGQPG